MTAEITESFINKFMERITICNEKANKRIDSFYSILDKLIIYGTNPENVLSLRVQSISEENNLEENNLEENNEEKNNMEKNNVKKNNVKKKRMCYNIVLPTNDIFLTSDEMKILSMADVYRYGDKNYDVISLAIEKWNKNNVDLGIETRYIYNYDIKKSMLQVLISNREIMNYVRSLQKEYIENSDDKKLNLSNFLI